jgi:inosine/xanthosine triphosphatase
MPMIAVGSVNPVKVRAVTNVVRRWRADWRVEGVGVPSGVPDQPWGDTQTIAGARARAVGARAALGAAVGLGLEGGVVEGDAGLRTCAWAVAAFADGSTSVGGSLSMPLPPAVATLVRGGMELGHAMDAFCATSGTKHGSGAVGILTAGLVDREQAYEVLVAYALAPLLSAPLWAAEVR